ncbi:transposase, partial [uncultured Marinobacter sp.]|uniref:transposase n=1 Tax=uncultured Marinobacter sp. TaxID=187379 RepID=UPI002596B4A2
MRHLEGTPRSQTLLLPPSVEDYVPDDHPVRVIDAFVDSLNLSEMGFRKAQTADTGRRPYHPGDLLKLYSYAYLNQTSSTRRLEKECHRNLEVLWL